MAAELLADQIYDKILRNASISSNNSNSLENTGGQPEISTKVSSIFEQCRYPKYILYEHNLPASVVCVSFIFFGVVYSLFGYRCFKAIMFLTGCVFGTSVVYYICTQDAILPQYAIVGVSLGAGILFGLITMLIQYVGLFMTGFHTGLLLGLISISAADVLHYKINSLWTNSSILMGFGVIFAFLTLAWKKGMTIFGSSLFGSAMLAASLDYFVEKLVMVKWIWDRVMLKRTVDPCWLSWTLLCIWPTVMFIGWIIQYAITGKGIHHERYLSSKKNRNNQNIRPRTGDQRAEMKQKKYRYLYQVRTAHGDVISQSYVQALQRKVIPGIMTSIGESSTLQSDATHLTTLPVDRSTQLPSSECNTVDSGVGVQFDVGYCNLSSRESMQSQIHDHCR